jgi:hypothetical protein
MASSGMLRHVALVKTDVSEECSASFIRVTGIGELGTTLAVTSNRHTLCAFLNSVHTNPLLDHSKALTVHVDTDICYIEQWSLT